MRDLLHKLFRPAFAASLALLAAAGCDNKDKYLRANPPSFELDALPQSVVATIEASSAWMYSGDADWFTTAKDGSDPSLLHIVIPETNESLSPREGTITIVSGDALQITIQVLQRALDASIEVTPRSLEEFDGKGTSAQTLTVETHNISEWGFTNRESWLTVTRGEGSESNVLTVTAAYSDSFEPRRDTIIIGAINTEFEALNDTIPVVQREVNLVMIHDETDTVIESTFETGPEAAGIEFSIASAYDWTLEAGGGAVPDVTSGEADTTGQTGLTVSIPENTGTETIEYPLTFECGGETYTFTIIQPAPGGDDENPLP